VEEEIQVADIEVKTEPAYTPPAKKEAAKDVHVSTAGVMLALALGVHSLFEGVAFGLMPTVEQMWQLGLGIFIHKACAALALGSKLSADGASRNQMLCYLGILAVTAPIGIIIGILITKTNPAVDVIFLSISGGTFIYVACTEIIVEQF